MSKCFHKSLTRIIVGLIDNSNPLRGAYRCEDCKKNLVVRIRPAVIKVKEQS